MKYISVLYCVIFLISNVSAQNISTKKIHYKGDSVKVYNNDIIAKIKTGKEIEANAFLKGKKLNFKPNELQKLIGIISNIKTDSITIIIDLLTNSQLFQFVEPNFLCTIESVTPNDADYQSGKQWAINKIRLPEA